jgi:hypothetical protein
MAARVILPLKARQRSVYLGMSANMSKITREIIEAHLACPYKSYLKLKGNLEISISDEQIYLEESIDYAPSDCASSPECDRNKIIQLSVITKPLLKKGRTIIKNALIESDHISLCIDELKKVDGKSDLGDFHYIPILFSDRRKPQRSLDILLEVYSLALSKLQGRAPDRGIISRVDGRTSMIRLTRGLKKGGASSTLWQRCRTLSFSPHLS